MFCRNCGKEIPEGSKFCSFCGTMQIVSEEAAAPELKEEPEAVPEEVIAEETEVLEAEEPVKEEPEEPVKEEIEEPAAEEKTKKKTGLIIGIAAAAVAVVVGAGAFFGGLFSGKKEAKDVILYAADEEIKLLSKADEEGIEIEDMQFSAGGSLGSTISDINGKYLYYVEEDGEEVNLMRVEVAKAEKEEAVEIESGIDNDCPWYINEDGSKVFYVKNDNVYMNDGKERTKILSDIDSEYFVVDKAGEKLFYFTEDEDKLYQMTIGGDDEKIAADVEIASLSYDPFAIYYTKEETLYKKVFDEKDPVKIAKDVYELVTADANGIYFVRNAEEIVELSTLIDDDLASADLSIKEPSEEDFISVDTIAIDEKFLREFYASNEGWNYDAGKEYYDTEVVGTENDTANGNFAAFIVSLYGEEIVNYAAESKGYMEKYENDEIYITFDLDVEKPELSFTIVDLKAMEEAEAAYEAIQDREALREEFTKCFTVVTKELWYSDGEEETLIAEDLRKVYGYENGTLIYSTYQYEDVDKFKMSELKKFWGSAVLSQYREAKGEGKSLLFSAKGDEVKAIDVEDSLNAVFSPKGDALYIFAGTIGDDFRQDKEEDEIVMEAPAEMEYEAAEDDEPVEEEPEVKTDIVLYKVEIKNGVPGKAEELSDDAENLSLHINADGSIVLSETEKNGSHEIIIDGEVVDSDIYSDSALGSYEGGLVYLYDFSEKSGAAELRLYSGGKAESIADDVRNFTLIGGNLYYTNTDDELFLWQKKEAVMIDEDVELIPFKSITRNEFDLYMRVYSGEKASLSASFEVLGSGFYRPFDVMSSSYIGSYGYNYTDVYDAPAE